MVIIYGIVADCFVPCVIGGRLNSRTICIKLLVTLRVSSLVSRHRKVCMPGLGDGCLIIYRDFWEKVVHAFLAVLRDYDQNLCFSKTNEMYVFTGNHLNFLEELDLL